MGVEVATYVDGLVTSNPTPADFRRQGDDQLRLIKTTLKNTFPNSDKPFWFPRAEPFTANAALDEDYDNSWLIGDATAGNITLTLPTLTAADEGWGLVAQKVDTSVNTVTLGGTIIGESGYVLHSQWEAVRIMWTGTAWTAVGFSRKAVSGAYVFSAIEVGLLTITSTSHALPARGTTAQRPGSPTQGAWRYNTTLDLPEFADVGGNWRQPSMAQIPRRAHDGLVVQNNSGTPNTQVDIDAREITVSTATGIGYRLRNVDVTINASTTGVNGLDQSGLANNTTYAALVIYNPTTNTVAGLLCTAARWTAGTFILPTDYTAYELAGWMFTGGSATFYRVKNVGKKGYYLASPTPVSGARRIVAGPAGTWSLTSPALSSVDISAIVPPTAAAILVLASNVYQTAGPVDDILVAPSTSWGGANMGPAGTAGQIWPVYLSTTGNSSISAWMVLESATSIAWVGSSSESAIACGGWEDN